MINVSTNPKAYRESIREQAFRMIRDNPGIVRTEIRDRLDIPNNIITPVIKELVDMGLVYEGTQRMSRTTNKPGRTLYVSEHWKKEYDAQNRIFD